MRALTSRNVWFSVPQSGSLSGVEYVPYGILDDILFQAGRHLFRASGVCILVVLPCVTRVLLGFDS